MGEATRFFKALFGGYREPGFIELRSLSPRPDGGKVSHSYYFKGLPAALNGLELWLPQFIDQSKDAYFGVLPRASMDAHRSAVTQARTLWVDIDAKDRSKEECIRALYTGRVPSPSYVVSSGGGVHAYWLLEETVRDIGHLEDCCYGLASAVGGDHCHNADRILRVPGTYNFKDPSNPRKVEVITATDMRYPLAAFDRFAAVGRAHRLATPDLEELNPTPVPPELLRDRLPEFIVEYVLYGLSADIHNTFGGDRSRLDFYIITKLLRNDFTAQEVAGILTDSAYGISEKTLSKRGRGRATYIARSIGRAQALLAEKEEEYA